MATSMLTIALGFLFFAWGQHAVLAKSFKFQFDNVTQCEPVSISFSGTVSDSVPVSLVLLPLDAPPVEIDIPTAAINSSGVYVTFFPLAAGTQFVASLLDSDGYNSAKVSDLFSVLPSDDVSCLPAASQTNQSLFSLPESITQCSNFTVTYNTSAAPTVRLFQPKGSSFALEMTSNDVDAGSATYLMNFSRQHEAVLLLQSGSEGSNTSDLLSIAGDATTSNACIQKQSDDDTAEMTTTSHGLSKGAIIGISVGCGVLILTTVAIILYILLERQRKMRRSKTRISFRPYRLNEKHLSVDSMEKAVTNEGFAPVPHFAYNNGYVSNPPYTQARYSTDSSFSRGSIMSWTNAVPNSVLADEISSRDIEQMLDKATFQNHLSLQRTPGDRSSFGNLLSPGMINAMMQQTPGARSSFGNLATPLSPPVRASVHQSTDIQDPFANTSSGAYPSGVPSSTVHGRNSYEAPSVKIDIMPPPPAAVGLPSSPRDRLKRVPSSGSSGGASGVGGFPRPLYINTARDSVSSWGNDQGITR